MTMAAASQSCVLCVGAHARSHRSYSPKPFKTHGSARLLSSPWDKHAVPQLGALKSTKPLFYSSILHKFIARSTPNGGQTPPYPEDSEKEKLSQVSKRLEKTGRYFKRLGGIGFWSQLVCTVVSAVILSFSVVITGTPTSPTTFYLTAGGIIAAFLSVFWSFNYIRLAEQLRKYANVPTKVEQLRKYANVPTKAPARGDVVKKLKNGIIINIAGMCATILGMQSTVGILVAKALTSTAAPYYQGVSPGYSPVLALDVFLVQACGNTLLSHFLGLVFSLELLRSVTLPIPSETLKPKLA